MAKERMRKVPVIVPEELLQKVIRDPQRLLGTSATIVRSSLPPSPPQNWPIH